MKQFINLLGALTAGYFGYTLEPQLRFQLTGESASTAPLVQEAESPALVSEAPALTAPEQPAPVAPPVEIAPTTPTAPEIPIAGDSMPAEVVPDAAPEVIPAEPTPEAAPAEAPSTPATAPSGDPVEAMQTSIRAGKIKEFTFEQVLKWEPAADETVEGETYKIGLASYKAETIFGEKTIQAKALIKDGIVQKWIWPKSGMEIK
jgi:hypothetical protein